MKPKMIIVLIVVIILLSGCSAWDKAYEEAASLTFSVISFKGPSALSFIKAMEPGINPTVRLGDTVRYSFEEDENKLYSQLMKGETDIALVPTEMAARLYSDGAGYRLAAVNTGGYLYVVAADESIASLSDLKGKVVQIAGENSADDIVLKYLLIQNGMEPGKDLTLEYAPSAEELVKGAIGEKSGIMLLSEPWVSDLLSKNNGFKIALDIQVEWANVVGTAIPLSQTCLIVKNEIVSQKTESWNLFLEDYRDSIKWVNSNPAKTAEILERHEVGISKELAEEVILRSNLEYLDSSNAKTSVEKYLNIFLKLSPELIGDKMPNEDFY